MIRKLLYTILFALSVLNVNAQSIGIIGVFNGWSADAVMNTTDNVTYTLQNFTFLVTGELKFRQDGSWENNWGSAEFPTGVATQGGANILVSAGTYDVTFDRITGAYSFVAVFNNFDVIGFNGGFNNFGTIVPMVTIDGIAYEKIDYQFTGNGVKFVRESPAPATNWGNTAFPSGTASINGSTIPLTAGFYNVDFNTNTLAYNFVPVPVSIIGDAAVDFYTDLFMTTTDGINFTLNNIDLIGGKSLKFRSNSTWVNNWGGTEFPTGAAVLNDLNQIIVNISGTYDITFNRLTGAYAFTLITSTFPIISINDTVMQTTDGVAYTSSCQSFSASNQVQFKDPINTTTFWGATAFPSGTAIIGSSDAIAVPAGIYTVTFNRITGAYSFLNTNNGSISLIGTFNGWSGDVVLDTTDYINYTLQNFTLLANGELKFRQDGSWANNWGAADFPSGVATQGGANIAGLEGTYNVFFNRITGEYSFVQVNGNYDLIGFNGGFNNFGPSVPMPTADGVTYIKTDYHFAGDGVKFIINTPVPTTIWGNTTFPSGNATLNGPTIPLTAGFYNLDFNKNTLAYNFVPVPVSIIGDAAIDFVTDIEMTTTDGINFTLYNQGLIGGKHLKFRTNYNWTTNWGGNGFPTGTAVLSGLDDIIVDITGTYDITFNRLTGAYSFFNTNNGSISLIGAFNGWSADVVLDTTDYINYTLQNFTLLENGDLKFRQDGSWANNWGAADFPSGISILGGANILGLQGTYNVMFNRITGAYSFVQVNGNYDLIGFNGGFNNFGSSVSMPTADGITYFKTDYHFAGDGVKFVRDTPAPTTIWGNTTFPSGNATLNGPTIPLTAGFYNVDFNKNTLAYNFVPVSVSIIGDAAIDFASDINMTTTDGINFTLNNQSLIGEKHLKFRTNHNWTTNWGGISFPVGTADLSGLDILVDISGIYNINFNRVTGDYVFTLLSGVYPVVSNNGMVMQTTNGVVYTSPNQSFTTTIQVQFNDPTNPDTVWGATAFPSGTAVAASPDKITVPPGFFNLTFNRTTGEFSYAVVPISIIGPGISNWDTDVTLESTNYGINSSKMNVVFVGGDIKFRANADSTISWGGSTTFPTGTATTTGAGNITVPAGTYNFSFNRVTGAYNFSNLSATSFEKSNLALYPNPTTKTFAINGAFENVKVYSITGQLVKTFTKTVENQNLNVSDLNSGVYFVKAVDASNIEKTTKLIKQ